MRIFTCDVAFHFFVTDYRTHFKFNTSLKHSKSQPTYDKASLKWACPRQVIHRASLVYGRSDSI